MKFHNFYMANLPDSESKEFDNLQLAEKEYFEEFIKETWDKKYHNFSVTDEGTYYFSQMEDAWVTWWTGRLILLIDIKDTIKEDTTNFQLGVH